MNTRFRETIGGSTAPSTDTSAGQLWDMHSTSLQTTEKPAIKVIEECLRSALVKRLGVKPIPKAKQYVRPVSEPKSNHKYSDKFLALFYPGTWGGFTGYSGRYWSERAQRYYLLFFAKADIETGDWYIDAEWMLGDVPQVSMAQRRPTKANDRFLKLVNTDDPYWQAVLDNTTYNH